MQINLNADLGEGFGAYDIGDDQGMLDCVGAANVACGFHAGDPDVMRRAVRQAKDKNVSIGAHPGFADILGFGRRKFDLSPSQIENMVAYQVGALCAIATLEGVDVTHVKPHGALSNIAAVEIDVAKAIARAIRAVDAKMIFLAIAGSMMERAGFEADLTVAREGFCDRQYEDAGNLVSRKIAGSVYRDPEPAVRQVIEMIDGKLRTPLRRDRSLPGGQFVHPRRRADRTADRARGSRRTGRAWCQPCNLTADDARLSVCLVRPSQRR